MTKRSIEITFEEEHIDPEGNKASAANVSITRVSPNHIMMAALALLKEIESSAPPELHGHEKHVRLQIAIDMLSANLNGEMHIQAIEG